MASGCFFSDQWARQTDEQREKYQARIAELEADLRYTKDLLDTAQSELVARTEQLSGNLGVVTAERDRLTSDLVTMSANLQQDLHDKIEELKIVERKNAGTVRDLQKQLHSEKKRLERLQVRLNEVLRDGGVKMKTLSDDSADFTEREETGSVSSWSFVSAKSMNKKQAGDNRSDSSKTETDTGLASSMTDQEIKDMVARITRLQQEKSTLLERVNMLETGNAAMAEDLLNKAAVINRYLRTTPGQLLWFRVNRQMPGTSSRYPTYRWGWQCISHGAGKARQANTIDSDGKIPRLLSTMPLLLLCEDYSGIIWSAHPS